MFTTYSATRLILIGITIITLSLPLSIAIIYTILNPHFKEYTLTIRRRNNENAMQMDFEKKIKRDLMSQNLKNLDFYKGLHLHG